MRLRLFLSYMLIILIAISSLAIVLRLRAANAVRDFMFRGGALGLENMVEKLEACYSEHQSWENCKNLLNERESVQGGNSWWSQGSRRGKESHTGGGMPGMWLQILDTDGMILAGTENPHPNAQVDDNTLQNTIPLLYEGEEVGYLLPEGFSAFSPQQEDTLMAQLNRAALIAAALSGGVALLLAFLLAYNLLRPIQKLTQAANRVGKGDLSQRVHITGDKELATLGRVFNQMTTSLKQAEKRRQALTADIAHELRTPLAIQQAHLEALQDGIYPLSNENLAPIAEQNQSLIRLVKDLRTLALADAGQLSLERTPTDFHALIHRVVKRFEPQAQAKGVTFSLSLARNCPTLEVDPQRIEQVLNNLLSNALRYSPENHPIKLILVYNSEQVRVTVRDFGPGIPAEDLPNLFDRFYKSDKARVRSKGGTGLGLSISQKLIEAHGATIEASNHAQGGAVFTITFRI